MHMKNDCASLSIVILNNPILEVTMSEGKPWYAQWWNTRIVVETVVLVVLLTIGIRLAQNAELFTLSGSADVAIPTGLAICFMFFRIKQSGKG
ncbi:MAG: hypothetical protein OSB10_01915 [Planctomycetota bacterium]|nr:hypothetical protein [Planctomycetota bacterium]